MTTTSDPGPLVSPRVASHLAGIDPADLDNLIRCGAVRTARVKGRLYVALDDAERAVHERPEGGGR